NNSSNDIAAIMTTAIATKEKAEKQEEPQKEQIKISECQALNNIKKIVAKSRYHSNEISETDDELADDKRRKMIQHLLDDDHNNHV
ncbi:14092_t:CDS:2, partial [Dentiscutata heterogama]